MRFLLLKFRPAARRPAPEGRAGRSRRRPRPAITRDNAFFWEGIERGELLIQRCSCGKLRHPPGPTCPSCHSLDWDPLEASGRGTVYSYVVAHYPAIPPFSYPNIIALVELEDGVRLVANLVGVQREQVAVGIPVDCEIVEVEEDFKLPQFRPRQS